MRVEIDGYEVEVKAKGWGSTRFNKQDTMAFLCSLCVELIQARDGYKERKLTGCEYATQKSIENIRALLEENNYIPTV